MGNVGGNSGTAILFGNGDGTVQTAVLPTNLNTNFAAQLTADLNNDGKADLVSFYAPNSQVALGNGDGTFNTLPAMACPANVGCEVVAIADINGDGKLDTIISETLSRTGITVNVRLGNGDGTFGSDIAAQSNGQPPLVADMNGDGQPDLVFPTNSGVAVLLNTTAPGFSIGPASGSQTSQTVTAGQTASFSLVLAPTGKFSGAVSLSCSIAPTAATAPPTCSLCRVHLFRSAAATPSRYVTVGTTAAVTTGAVPPTDFPLRGIHGSFARLCCWARRSVAPKPEVAAGFGCTADLVGVCFLGGLWRNSSSSPHTTLGTPAGTYRNDHGDSCQREPQHNLHRDRELNLGDTHVRSQMVWRTCSCKAVLLLTIHQHRVQLGILVQQLVSLGISR